MKETGDKKQLPQEKDEGAFFKKYSLSILIFLIAVIVGFVFHHYLLFEKLYLFKGLASDSLNDTYPNYILISDYLRTDGIPKWSFRQGIGQGIFPFSFPDPFVSFLYLLGREKLAFGIAYMELLKIILSGIIFYFFIRKRGLSHYSCIIGGLLYSFSSFMIIGSCWNIFSTEALYLALLLLAFEKLYQDNNWTLFPVSVALIAILQPFDLWLFGIFLFLYILVRYHEENEGFHKLFRLLLKTGLLVCLGVAISSFFFLSEVWLMLHSPRVTGQSGYADQLLSQPLGFDSEIHYVTAIMRLFSSELLGPSNNFRGWNNFMEAPLFYCGLINLLLVPQLFQFLDEKRKRYYGVWLGFMVLPVILPFLRYSFWLFTGNYYRVYSFFVAFILLFFSIQALHYVIKYKKIDRKLLLITVVVLLIALYYPYDFLNRYNVLNTHLRNVITVFIILYTGLLYLLPTAKNPFRVRLLCLGLVCFELFTFTKMNVDERHALTAEEYHQKKGYSDYTNDAIAWIKTVDKGFFRVAKNYSSGPSINPSLNDSKIQQYRGTSSYHSFNQLYYVRFLSGMNIIDEKNEDQTRWILGLRNVPSLHSYMGVKYFLTKGKPFFRSIYDSLNTIGNVRIYRNKFALPLGFTYSRQISRKDFDLFSPLEKENTLYDAFVLNDSIYRQYAQVLPKYQVKRKTGFHRKSNFFDQIKELKEDTLNLTKFRNSNIIGNITLEERKMLFFSIPYSPGWKAKVNGKKTELIRINLGFLGLLLEKGSHTVEITYNPPLYYTGAIISTFSIILYLVLLFFKKRKEVIS